MVVYFFKFLLEFIQFSLYELYGSDRRVDYPVQHCHRVSPHVEPSKSAFMAMTAIRAPSTTAIISFCGIDHSAAAREITLLLAITNDT